MRTVAGGGGYGTWLAWVFGLLPEGVFSGLTLLRLRGGAGAKQSSPMSLSRT